MINEDALRERVVRAERLAGVWRGVALELREGLLAVAGSVGVEGLSVGVLQGLAEDCLAGVGEVFGE